MLEKFWKMINKKLLTLDIVI